MTIREILRMGDPRLLRVAPPVTAFDTPELHALVADLFDTMEAANGAGLAAPRTPDESPCFARSSGVTTVSENTCGVQTRGTSP